MDPTEPEERLPEREPGSAMAEPEETFPWPPRSGESIFSALVQTWHLSTFESARFFRSLPVPGPIGPALIYFLIIGIPAAGLSLFWQMLGRLAFTSIGLSDSGAAAKPSGWLPVIQFLSSPLWLLVGIGFSFVIHHLFLLLFGGARRGAGTTLRVLAYSYSPALFAIVPVLGTMVGWIWTLVLAIIGLREAHRTDTWRAACAILVPIALLFTLGIFIAITIGVLAAFLTL